MKNTVVRAFGLGKHRHYKTLGPQWLREEFLAELNFLVEHERGPLAYDQQQQDLLVQRYLRLLEACLEGLPTKLYRKGHKKITRILAKAKQQTELRNSKAKGDLGSESSNTQGSTKKAKKGSAEVKWINKKFTGRLKFFGQRQAYRDMKRQEYFLFAETISDRPCNEAEKALVLQRHKANELACHREERALAKQEQEFHDLREADLLTDRKVLLRNLPTEQKEEAEKRVRTLKRKAKAQEEARREVYKAREEDWVPSDRDPWS